MAKQEKDGSLSDTEADLIGNTDDQEDNYKYQDLIELGETPITTDERDTEPDSSLPLNHTQKRPSGQKHGTSEDDDLEYY